MGQFIFPNIAKSGTRDRRSIFHCAIRDLEALVDNREGLMQLLLVDAEWRIGEKCVPAHERVEALFAEKLSQGGHFL